MYLGYYPVGYRFDIMDEETVHDWANCTVYNNVIHIQWLSVIDVNKITETCPESLALLPPPPPLQGEDIYKAKLIELNVDLIEWASLVIHSAIANAMDWGDIELLRGDSLPWQYMASDSSQMRSRQHWGEGLYVAIPTYNSTTLDQSEVHIQSKGGREEVEGKKCDLFFMTRQVAE